MATVALPIATPRSARRLTCDCDAAMPGQAIRGLNLTGDEDSVDMEGNHLYHILDGGKHGAELEINVCIPPLFPMRPVRGIRSLGIRSEAWCHLVRLRGSPTGPKLGILDNRSTTWCFCMPPPKKKNWAFLAVIRKHGGGPH